MITDDDDFTAEQVGPPRRAFWIARDPPSTSNLTTRGWGFGYEQMGASGEWEVGWDSWEEWFFEILRYPPQYASEPLTWRRVSTGEVVDLASLQPKYDGKAVGPDETPESAGLRAPTSVGKVAAMRSKSGPVRADGVETEPPAIAAARQFVGLMVEGEPPIVGELIRALDHLAAAFHAAPQGAPSESEVEPPEDLSAGLLSGLGARFPGLGFYPVADPLAEIEQAPMMGDAIDDLGDIAGDLAEVLWRFDNLGADDAHLHFRFLFRVHWGRHLRELSLYLHAVENG